MLVLPAAMYGDPIGHGAFFARCSMVVLVLARLVASFTGFQNQPASLEASGQSEPLRSTGLMTL